MPEGEIKLRPEIETLSQKLEADPRSKVFAQLADAYRKSNMLDEAIEIAKKGLEVHPNYGAAHLVLGRCYLEKRIYSLAREEFERVASLDPHNFAALKLLADVHFSQGAKEEAIRRYRQVLDIDPLNSEVAERLAQLLPPPKAQEPEPKAPEPIAAPSRVEAPPAAKEEAAAETPAPFLILGTPLTPPEPEPPAVAPEATPAGPLGGRLPPRTTLSSEDVADMVERMIAEKEPVASAIPPPPVAPSAPPEPEPQSPAPEEVQAAPEAPFVLPEPVAEAEQAYEPAQAPFAEAPKETLLGREEVSDVVEGLLNEKSPELLAPTLPEEEPPLPAPIEAPIESGSTSPEPPSEPERAPLTGEEVAGIVEGFIAERNLGTPAIPPPEAPQMIEQKPSEVAPLVRVEEAPVPAKAKGFGATATLAELYEQQGFYDKALELYEQVLEESPENPALQAKVRELRKRTYWEETAETEAAVEGASAEVAKSSWEGLREVPRKEEAAVPPPKVEEQKPEPRAEEQVTPSAPAEKPAPVEAESAPQPGTPLFHPEAGPKPEGPERKGEIKSFQEWLDSLKKPRPGV